MTVLAITACGDDDTPAQTVTTYAPIPSPSAEIAGEIEVAVADIYAGVPDGKAADWARSTCGDMIRDGLQGDQLVDRIVLRFSGGDRPDPTSEQAEAILALIEEGNWCAPR